MIRYKKQLMHVVLVFLFILSYALTAHSKSPFEDRNREQTEDFYISHSATVTDIIPARDNSTQFYLIKIDEPYFSWNHLILKMSLNEPIWKDLRVGDEVNLNMQHTTSDVPIHNKEIREHFFHAITNINSMSYLGFSSTGIEVVKDIKLQSEVIDSEIGPITLHYLKMRFNSGHEVSFSSNFIEHLDDVARPGDEVLVAEGAIHRAHNYEPNPYGEKNVIQTHHLGPLSNEPLYLRNMYKNAVFNLTQGKQTF
tara:strand:- start:235 stop:993 length:759 start_codon:yes stop_codon:yes gene_type:complete